CPSQPRQTPRTGELTREKLAGLLEALDGRLDVSLVKSQLSAFEHRERTHVGQRSGQSFAERVELVEGGSGSSAITELAVRDRLGHLELRVEDCRRVRTEFPADVGR